MQGGMFSSPTENMLDDDTNGVGCRHPIMGLGRVKQPIKGLSMRWPAGSRFLLTCALLMTSSHSEGQPHSEGCFVAGTSERPFEDGGFESTAAAD